MEKTRVFKWILENERACSGKFVFVLVLAMALSACTSHPCREPRMPELDKTVKPLVVLGPNGVPMPVEPPPKLTTTSDSNGETIRARVYKPDGSRQCEKSAGIALETMERELAGFVVHNREKRKDGLMHIQICGSPSGMINLFEIDASFVKQAEQRGFKRWED